MNSRIGWCHLRDGIHIYNRNLARLQGQKIGYTGPEWEHLNKWGNLTEYDYAKDRSPPPQNRSITEGWMGLSYCQDKELTGKFGWTTADLVVIGIMLCSLLAGIVMGSN